MQEPKALLQAAGESVGKIDERFAGYRAALVRQLGNLIRTQSDASSKNLRRQEIKNEIANLASQMTPRIQTEGTEQ